MSVYKKLQECRVELQNKELKKSGKNKHLGFNYFELADFLPTVNELFKKHGLFSQFNIEDVATLTIVDTEDESTTVFTTKTAPATLQKATPVQELGAEHTYIKRYLYINALEIIENDIVDQVIGTDDVKPKEKATKQQVARIIELFEPSRIPKMLQYAKVEKLEDLTLQQASDFIKKQEKML